MRRQLFLRVAKVLSESWLLLGITLLLLAGLELVAQAGIALRGNWDNNHLVESGLRADVYRNLDWAAEYWREDDLRLATRPSDWHPYIYWRHSPFQGKYVNVDENGIRLTWNNSISLSTPKIRVFMFGGSALWGTGARDEYTIPSLLSKKLDAQGIKVSVTNFGEAGYVSTQDMITLMLELQKGDIPDAVIFYDGANDVFSAFQQGVAGIPENEYNRVSEFNQLNWREGLAEKLAIYRVIRGVVQSVRRPTQSAQEDTRLAGAVLDSYFSNMRIVQSLAQDYGFAVAFYWQPIIYDKKSLSSWENRQLNQYGEEGFFKHVDQMLKERVKSRAYPGFYDLTDAFSDHPGTIFIDLFHISEEGNNRIADLIVQTLPYLAPHSKTRLEFANK